MSKIDLPDSDVPKWMLFQEHYQTFELLVQSDVFVQRSAAITLNFDHNGILQTIERRDTMYSTRYPLR